MFNVNVRDPNGSSAKVTANGELIVQDLDYSRPHYVALAVNDQIYNVVTPESGKKFIIKGILISAKRNVNGDSSVHVYESTSVGGTSETTILNIDINKGLNTFMSVTMATKEHRWVNATADDNTVGVTIFGYYVNA